MTRRVTIKDLRGLQRDIARHDLLRFTLYTKKDYLAGWFHEELAKRLDQFLDDVIAKKSPRLMVMAPPRHGKTELVSKRFPAYALGRYPDLSFIGTSHGGDLASDVNRDIQRIIDSEEYAQLFPSTALWGKNIRTVADGSYLRNSDIFEIVNHKGRYKSAGVGGDITGRGGHVLLIDDPVKNAEEAFSKTMRDSTWAWYDMTLRSRCEPGGGILLILTRWHFDDLAGRILHVMEKGGERWDIVRFPALAEEDELHRKKGEPLHPERYTLAMLENMRTGTSEEPGVGSKAWASLYQQRPAAAEGVIFKREDWRWFKPKSSLSTMDVDEKKQMLQIYDIHTVTQHWDIAVGGKETSDYSACTTLGVSKNKYYVLDVWKRQCEFPEVKRQVKLLHDAWRPSVVTVEGGGSAGGKSIIQDLKRDTRIPFVETVTTKDKVLRANLVSPTHEAGMCYLPEGGSWVADFMESISAFPNATHDDDADSFIMAMENAIGGPRMVEFSPEALAILGVR